MVVPLSAIIDQLKNKLTSIEIETLLTAILSNKKSEVRPGDLITADLMNQILSDLHNLNLQIATLKGSTAPENRHSQAITTFYDTWSFYGSLVKNGEFLPNVTSANALQSATKITTYLQDVMYAAMSGGTLGYYSESIGLLDAFRRLYLKQHDVVVLFSAPIDAILDTTEHKKFATLLNTILEQDNAIGEISLKKALDSSNLDGAIAAQNRINGMVRNQSGDITTGNLDVIYQGAVGNTETLVIGNTFPVFYRFSVTNKTNRNLDVQLKAEFLPPRQTWSTQLSIVGTDGNALSQITLAPFDPSKPTDQKATKEVRIAVTTPTGVSNNEKGILQLSAFVPAPINRRALASRQLTVANAPINQTPGVVEYLPGIPIVSGDLSNATEMTPVTMGFEFSFGALQGPASRNFRFHLDITAPGNPDTFFFIEFGPANVSIDEVASTTVKKSSLSFAMQDGSKRSITASITPLTGSINQSLTFTARVESATDGVVVQSQPFTISVKN
jgi:hypothetical protein